MAEFVDAIANDLVASGVGQRYNAAPTSGTSIQVNSRRDSGHETIVALQQFGGTPFERATSEDYLVQVLVDGASVVTARDTARTVYEQFRDRKRETLGGFDVLWVRPVTLPQAVPLGPGAGTAERFQYTFSLSARVVT